MQNKIKTIKKTNRIAKKIKTHHNSKKYIETYFKIEKQQNRKANENKKQKTTIINAKLLKP